MQDNNFWQHTELSLEENYKLEKLINDAYQYGNFEIDEIINLFRKIGIPIEYGAPGFYDSFYINTSYNQELIEDWIYDHNYE